MIQNKVMSYLEKFLLPHPAFYINEAEGPTGIQSSVVGASYHMRLSKIIETRWFLWLDLGSHIAS
jgi:hypothetical protein